MKSFVRIGLSVVTIFWFNGSVIAQNADGTKGHSADLIIQNVTVRQCDRDFGTTDAIAIKAGRFVALGQKDVRAWITNETKIMDGKGGIVTPGLSDSHLHFVGLGHSLQMLNLSGAENWSAIIDQVVEASQNAQPGTWIEGRGWHQSKWNRVPDQTVDGYPHHQQLSELVPNHPVLLTHASGHACFANELAMKLAKVGSRTANPNGGEILRDENGEPTGVFRENAQSFIRRALDRSLEKKRRDPHLANELLSEQIRLAGAECLKHGITSVHDAGSSFELATKMAARAESGTLPVRIYMMIRTGSEELAFRMPKRKRIDIGKSFFSVRSVKVSIDGALGPHGAWLLDPYSDLGSSAGLNTVSLDELRTIAGLCRQHDWQLCVHAIGDRANREVLDVYEDALGQDSDSDHRWRIEHAQHLHPDDIPRFGRLGVIPAMQTNHCTSDAIFVPTRLGQRRSKQGAYVWRSLIDSGAIIPNGTDAPVESVDPRVSIYAAVTRQLKNGQQFYPDQCMSRREALLSYTLWPATAAFQDESLGSIEVGKRADLVLWDQDFITCEPKKILDATVVATILDGKVVYKSGKTITE